MNRSNPQRRVLLGAIVILIGVLALADNLNLFNTQQVIRFWPMLFIAFGILKIAQTGHPSGFFVGATLVAAGLLMTLSNMGLIQFDWSHWWPVLLILAGISSVLKGLGRRPPVQAPALTNANAGSDGIIDVFALMSGNKLAILSQDFRGGEATALMGGVEIDFRQASIRSEATLHVFVIWGGIVLKVPADWTVVCNGLPILGGISDNTVPPASPGKRLLIDGFVLMGGVDIKN